MSSIMRRRNGLIAWSVMGRLLSGVRVATPHLQTGRACYLSPPRELGGGALPRERFSPLAQSGHWPKHRCRLSATRSSRRLNPDDDLGRTDSPALEGAFRAASKAPAAWGRPSRG